MNRTIFVTSAFLTLGLTTPIFAADPIMCSKAGPQTPRDIASLLGNNTPDLDLAPASTELNLCNIHTTKP